MCLSGSRKQGETDPHHRDLACADDSARCEREVNDNSSGEGARVDAADAHKA